MGLQTIDHDAAQPPKNKIFKECDGMEKPKGENVPGRKEEKPISQRSQTGGKSERVHWTW